MSTKTIVIREAIDTDADAVQAVLLDAYGQYEQTLPEDRWEEYKENIISSVSEAATKSRLVAELDGEIVGSVFLFDSSEAAYGRSDLDIQNPVIRLLAVSRKARGLGVATELIRACARECREWGAQTVHLHTSDMMDSAVRLYERLGFERAFDKDIMNGNLLVKSYRLQLNETTLLL
ncbi:GNAT family N-acetyltransferase [Paenibacillus sepulcri]|uniref:GNAT family N-acetyltransferase n=1 Tax=Paenibacillus sepulcri TaxID=359917 RepID=A0ABS7CDH8_9BACL|nr:GNAT family N-acetyltransferase [Paenibacillus sepulcri]